MIARIKTAFNKLFFCGSITANISSFILLVWHTKKYKWRKKDYHQKSLNVRPVKYSLRFNKQIRNVYLRTYSGDLDIFYEIFWKKTYAFSRNYMPHLIVDFGANVGLSPLFFLNQFPQSKIICVEPDPGNIKTLKRNLEQEITDNNIIVSESAITDKDGIMQLSNSLLKYNSKLLAGKNSDESNVKVKVLSMNSFLQKYSIDQIDILKIDIEGSEVELFSADAAWLSMVKEVIIETHSIVAEEICSKIFLQNQFTLQDHTANIFHWIRS